MRYVPADQLAGFVGQGLGPSDWLTIDQARIDLFAQATGDYQFIHVDPARAATTPYGGTIAHGLLTLSLIPHLMEGTMVMPEGLARVINYGLENVRYLQPVPVNAQVRLHATLLEASEKRVGQWLLRVRATLEIQGAEKPALVAEPLFLCFV
jgi:acyl dehydratase